jgi:hypothetical protein
VRADALIDPDGTFVLTTYDAGDGAAEGEYAVAIVWNRPSAEEPLKPGPNVLPARYARPDTSPLRAKVTKGANVFLFELTSK